VLSQLLSNKDLRLTAMTLLDRTNISHVQNSTHQVSVAVFLIIQIKQCDLRSELNFKCTAHSSLPLVGKKVA